MTVGIERAATVIVLQDGAAGEVVRSTITLVIDGDRIIVLDPGMAPSQSAILDPLADAGVGPSDVTDVVISHHHPDHTVNIGLFGEARVHDHWAIYHHDRWTSRPAEGFAVSPSVLLWQTPGHTPQDVSTVIGTASGVLVATHLWWHADGPPDDPLAVDADAIHHGRARVLSAADRIIPGHGPAFDAGPTTPR